MLATAVLIGAIGGLVIGSFAGARRTASAFDRMIEHTDAADVLLNPNLGAASALDVADVAAIPGVRQVSVLDGGGAVLMDEDGDFDGVTQVFFARDRTGALAFDRPRVVSGRLFDPLDPTEVLVSDGVARRRGLRVGDQVTVGTIDQEAIAAWDESGADTPPPMTFHDQTIVGITIGTEQVVADDVFDYGSLLLTSAFADEHGLSGYYYGVAVDLEGGAAAVPAFRDAMKTLVPDEQFEFRTLSVTRDLVRRGVQPHVLALLAFAALVGVAATIVCGQVLTRQLDGVRRDTSTLSAIGVDRRGLRLAIVIRTAIMVVPGAALACVFAVALSPVFPLGVARRAEVHPGISVDTGVLAAGVVVLATVMTLWALIASRTERVDAVLGAGNPGVIDRLARASSDPALSTGLRAALSRREGATAASPRMAMLGLAVAVAAMASALTFGASLLRLVHQPSAYGWPWDLVVAPPGDDEYGPVIDDRLVEAPEFASTVDLHADQVQIGEHRVPAIGMDVAAVGSRPTVTEGRAPEHDDEIALGGRTMSLLDVAVGDDLVVGSGAATRTLRVVGQAVFPGLGTYSGADRTELGKGALLDRGTLAEVAEGFDARFVGVDLAHGVRAADGVAVLASGFENAVNEGEIEIIDHPQRPADVRSLESVRRTPELIAGVLGALAAVALCSALVASVRRRQNELAMLRTFGMQRRQLTVSVLWQATVGTIGALAFGVPIGVVVGRGAWSALAASMGVAPNPAIPVSLWAGVAAVVVLAHAAAILPARSAARLRPAVALRSE